MRWRLLLGLSLLTLAAGVHYAPTPIAEASLDLYQPDASIGASFVGHGAVSSDGLGQLTAGGKIQAEVPAGSTVEFALLYAATVFGGDTTSLGFNGSTVTLAPLSNVENPAMFSTSRADVTTIVRSAVGAGGGTFDFTVDTDPISPLLNGVALVVVYSNKSLPEQSISIFDGGLGFGPQTTVFNLGRTVNTSKAGFQATLSLGIQHGFQSLGAPSDAGTNTCGTGVAQYSTIDVNAVRLTSCAGNYDDGFGVNGALVTVGGAGDSLANPVDPFQTPGDGGTPRVEDDELYDITTFIHDGDSQLTLTTSNPSNDDSIFLAIVSVSGVATQVANSTNFVVLAGITGLGQFDDPCDGSDDNFATPESHASALMGVANDFATRSKSSVDVRAFSYNNMWNAGQRSYGDCETRKPLSDMAALFEQQFSALRQANPGKQWIVLSHSLGGVVSTYWLGKTATPADIEALRAVITFGSPLGGIDFGAFLQFTSWGGAIAGDLDVNNLATHNAIVAGATKAPVFEVTNKKDGVTNGLLGYRLTPFGAGFWDWVDENLGGECSITKKTCSAHDKVITSSKSRDVVDRVAKSQFVDDTKSLYGPADGGWQTEALQCHPPALGTIPAMGTIHETEEMNDYVSFNFTGSAITLLVTKVPAGGDFEVVIDGVSRGTFSSRSTNCEPRTQLRFSVGPGDHKFRVFNRQNKILEVDGFELEP